MQQNKAGYGKLIILILIVIATLGFTNPFSKQVTPTKRYVTGPEQSTSHAASWNLDDWKITPLAAYDIQARVLSKSRYYMDTESDLSPVDFALGWNKMADPGVYKKLSISQGGRWYYYSWGSDGPPIPTNEIISSSANTHLIPANDKVKAKLLNIAQDEIVNLSGYLVRVDKSNGWHWVSSLSRDDSGGGSCEVMWVESVTTSKP